MSTTGNPLLDNPATKAALIAQMGQQQAPQPQGAVMPPGGAQPSPALGALRTAPSQPPQGPINLPSGPMPAMPSTPAPHVIAPRGTSAGDEAELSRKLSTGSGISQIAGKIENSGLLKNHPVLGKILGIGAQGLAQIGDIGLRTLAPTLDAAIPGTSLHHIADVQGDQRQVAQDTENESRQAQTQATQAEVPLRQAQAAAAAEPNIAPLPTDQGYVGFNPKTGETKPITGAGGSQLAPYEKPQPIQHAVLPDGSVVAISRDLKTGAVSADEVFKGDGKAKPTITKLEINGKPHNVLVDENTGKTLKDLGETGEKPPTVNVNAGNAELDRIGGRLGKPYEAGNTAAESQLEKIADARAMINGSAAAQAVGIPKILTALVSGQGSGVRITQAELNMIAHARGIQGDVEGFINKVSGKGVLAPEQQKQFTQILDDVKARVMAKQQIANETLDKINSASSREEVVQADKQARQKFQQLEKYGHFEGETVTIKGKPVVINKIHPDGSFE